MSLQRRINWSTALQDMRANRAPASERAAFIATENARKLALRIAQHEAEAAVRAAKLAPLVVAGQYDRAAILRRAWAYARRARAYGDKRSWQALVGKEMRHAWAEARDLRRATAH